VVPCAPRLRCLKRRYSVVPTLGPMGDIGKPLRKIEFEPMPDDVPVLEPSPDVEPALEPVPA